MTQYMIDTIAKCFHEWLIWHYMTTISRDIATILIVSTLVYMVTQFVKKMKF